MITPAGQCPFHSKPERPALDEHAQMLRTEGLGPISAMCTTSVIFSGQSNPDLPAIHEREGEKFLALVNRIAPPELVVGYIQQACAIYPPLCALSPEDVGRAFNDVFQLTKFKNDSSIARDIPTYRYPVPVTRSYYEFCAREPNLFLACLYLSVCLQSYSAALARHVTDDGQRPVISQTGMQFNASNLVNALPVALHSALLDQCGNGADISAVDKKVVTRAFTILSENGQFSLFARGPDRKVVGFHCPMKGYLADLVINNEALQPIVSALCRMEAALTLLGDSVPKDRAEFALSIHGSNKSIVQQIARKFVRETQSH